MSIHAIPSIEDALSCAINTLQEQPNEVPEAPSGWIQEAKSALESGDSRRMHACAAVIRKAHNQYSAKFDVKGWLFDLRSIYAQSLENGK